MAKKPMKRRKVKVVRLKPKEAVRVIYPKDHLPIVAHDHESGAVEVAPIEREQIEDKPFSFIDWLFGQ